MAQQAQTGTRSEKVHPSAWFQHSHLPHQVNHELAILVASRTASSGFINSHSGP